MARGLSAEQLSAAVLDLESGKSAKEVSRTHGIPYRTLMRIKKGGRQAVLERIDAAAPPIRQPVVVVVTGDILETAREGLESGITYLATVVKTMKPEAATPQDIRAVGESVVKVLATVCDTLEARRKLNQPNEIACLSNEQLLAEALKIAAERTAEMQQQGPN